MAIEHREHASVVTHPLAREELTRLRDVDTDQVAFREGLVRLGRLCGYELIADRFGTEPVQVETPLGTADGHRVAGRDDVVLVSILRAALPFVWGLREAFPTAREGVVSASREEAAGRAEDGTFPIAVEYVSLPELSPADRVVVADPMLATGSTMAAALEAVAAAGGRPERTIALSAVSAPAGLAHLRSVGPDVSLVTVAVDEELDEEGFIVPGLGDAGDRAFGTS